MTRQSVPRVKDAVVFVGQYSRADSHPYLQHALLSLTVTFTIDLIKLKPIKLVFPTPKPPPQSG
jgi:hypothetical protein